MSADVLTPEKRRFRALVNLLSVMPQVKSTQMIETLARVSDLPKPVRGLALRVWGFLHPLPYLLKSEEHEAEEAAEDPRDAFLRVWGDMTDKEREGLTLYIDEWKALPPDEGGPDKDGDE